MAYGTATLTGTYKTFDNQPAEGVVEIIPNSRSLVDSEGNVVLAGRVKVTLDAAGSFTVTLPATDDATVEPATGRQYTVVAKLRHTHLAAVTGVELATGATVDTADVASVPVVDATVTAAATVTQLEALQAEVDAHEANTANPHAVTKTQIGLGSVDNVSAASLRDRSTHTGTQPVASITGLAPVATSGSKADVGLGSVDNTSDADKPISTAQASALAAKQDATGPFLAPPSADTSGEAKLFGLSSQYSVATTGGLSMMKLDIKNTSASTGNLFMGVQVVTDSDATDSAAGVHVTNVGQSDGIYVAATGKGGTTPTNPTGIGIDLNRATAGTAERNSAGHTGYGVQIYDWSSTNQGTSGPCGLFLLKQANPDTDHRLVYLRANRRALEIVTPEGAGYTAAEPLLNVLNNAGALRWRVRADGNHEFANTLGLRFKMGTGNDGRIESSGSSFVQIVAGAGGFRVLTNDSLNTNFSVSEGGTVSFRDGGSIAATGTNGLKIGTNATNKLGFYGATAVTKPTGVAVTAAGIHAALVSLGLIGA